MSGLTRAQRDELVALINQSNLGEATATATLYQGQDAFDLVDAATGRTVRWRGEEHGTHPHGTDDTADIYAAWAQDRRGTKAGG